MSPSAQKKTKNLIGVKEALAKKYAGLRDRAKSDTKKKFFHHRSTVYSRQAESLARLLPSE
ncbi:MAG: hypothetical protein AAF532_14210 [Planctomycetota bacterium]